VEKHGKTILSCRLVSNMMMDDGQIWGDGAAQELQVCLAELMDEPLVRKARVAKGSFARADSLGEI
jgi:hypothetical protein